jgi:glutamate-1-semialdehyde 2,1-aminomutase
VCEIVPSAEDVCFTSSGTEATLMAIRLARAYTGRDRILKFDQHFHGWHDAVIGARGAESDCLSSSGVPAATSSNTVCVSQDDIRAVEEKLASDDIAAVIVEPTGASYGTLPLHPAFLSGLREATARHNTVLIFDEVVTGFRVAPGGAQARYGVTPDMTTLAKILAGGMPGGAVCGKSDILSMLEFRDGRWNAEQRVQHPGTFNANPVSAAAGIAMLEMVRTGGHHVHADALVERLVPAMNDVIDHAGVKGCVYGLASYFHITVGHDAPRPTNGTVEWPGEGLPPRTDARVFAALKRGMLNHGVDLMSGSGGFTSGVHSVEDIDRTVEAFGATLAAMQSDGQL